MQSKTSFKLSLTANPVNNSMYISLFIGLALSENLNVALFYIYSMQNAYNPMSIHDHMKQQAKLLLHQC